MRVKIPAAGKEYECGICPESTVGENTSLLMGLIADEICESVSESHCWHVYDGRTGRYYPSSAQAEAEGIGSGTVLVFV